LSGDLMAYIVTGSGDNSGDLYRAFIRLLDPGSGVLAEFLTPAKCEMLNECPGGRGFN